MNEKETMNVQMEKLFFTWVLEHPTQFFKVLPEYFKNDEIKFIFKIIKDEYVLSKNVPTPQQIVAMIKLQDPEEKINNNVIKVILKNDNSVHDKNWLERHFKAWKMSNDVKNRTYDIIEKIRNLKDQLEPAKKDAQWAADVIDQLKASNADASTYKSFTPNLERPAKIQAEITRLSDITNPIE